MGADDHHVPAPGVEARRFGQRAADAALARAAVAQQRGDGGVGQPEAGGEAGIGVAQRVWCDVRGQPGDVVDAGVWRGGLITPVANSIVVSRALDARITSADICPVSPRGAARATI